MKPRLSYSNKAKASARLEVRFICREKTKASARFRLIRLNQALAGAMSGLVCLNKTKASAKKKDTLRVCAQLRLAVCPYAIKAFHSPSFLSQ